MQAFGIQVHQAKNEAAVGGKAAAEIHAHGSGIKVLVVPTDEELCIAEQVTSPIQAQTQQIQGVRGGGDGAQQHGAAQCGTRTGEPPKWESDACLAVTNPRKFADRLTCTDDPPMNAI